MGEPHVFCFSETMSDPRTTAIQSIVEPILAEKSVELVELTTRPQGRQVLIRILVDKPGGITLAQCAGLNNHIGQALEQANVIEESYTVEVSSPGLDRPLTSKRDYERTVGESVQLDVKIEDGRYRPLEGVLLAVQPEAVVLKLPDGNVTVPFTDIRIAKKKVRW